METFRGDDGTRSSGSRTSDNQMTPETEARINKTIEPLDNAIRKFKQVVRATWPQEHPDAILLNEAAESLEEAHLLPNLLDLSLNKRTQQD